MPYQGDSGALAREGRAAKPHGYDCLVDYAFKKFWFSENCSYA